MAATLPLHSTTARELLRRRGNQHILGAAQLERWLVSRNLATKVDGHLIPTRLGYEVGRDLRFLGD